MLFLKYLDKSIIFFSPIFTLMTGTGNSGSLIGGLEHEMKINRIKKSVVLAIFILYVQFFLMRTIPDVGGSDMLSEIYPIPSLFTFISSTKIIQSPAGRSALIVLSISPLR